MTGKASVGLGPHRQNAEGASRPLAQQLVQLLSGDGVGHQAEDKEGGEDHAQSAAQERVQPHASVVRHVGSARKQTESGVNISSLRGANTLLFHCTQTPPDVSGSP